MLIEKIKAGTLILTAAILLLPQIAYSQKVGFMSSQMVRKHFPEAKMAEQRIQSMVEEWKRELENMQNQIDALKFEIKKNRLVWSDAEKAEKEQELKELEKRREEYAKSKFQPGGEYDQTVNQIMTPIEEKIYAAVQKVAADQGYDLILDQSKNPIPYTNYKYDLTVHVLRKLGVDAKELEKELQEKITKDPRNKEKESYSPRRRSRSRRPVRRESQREIERPEEQQQQQKEEEEIEPGENDKKLPDSTESPSGPGKRPVR